MASCDHYLIANEPAWFRWAQKDAPTLRRGPIVGWAQLYRAHQDRRPCLSVISNSHFCSHPCGEAETGGLPPLAGVPSVILFRHSPKRAYKGCCQDRSQLSRRGRGSTEVRMRLKFLFTNETNGEYCLMLRTGRTSDSGVKAGSRQRARVERQGREGIAEDSCNHFPALEHCLPGSRAYSP